MNETELYIKSGLKRTIWIFSTLAAIMITLFVVNQFHHSAAVTGDEMVVRADEAVNATLYDGMEYYAGCFSTMVTASVNPPVTLACMAILGTIENAQRFFPNVAWLIKVGDFLGKVPLVGTVKNLPISNPVAALILSLVALALFIIRSIPETKFATSWNIDKVEKYGGMVVTMGMALLPLATTEKLYAATEGANVVATKWVMAPKTYAVLAVVGVIVAILGGAIYFIVNTCANALESVSSVIPIPGVALVYQILESGLAMLLVFLSAVAPILAIILCVLIVIIAIILFPKVSLLATYYNYVYMKPTGKFLFHRKEQTSLLHKKFPRKAKKIFPEATFAIPCFSSKKIKFKDLPINRSGKLKKKELAWLVIKEDTPYLMKVKFIGKIVEIPLHGILSCGKPLYLEKRRRFIKIITQDRMTELIISNEYADQIETLMEQLKVGDYKSLGQAASEKADLFDAALTTES